MSFLATVGKDIKGVFNWLGSAKGKAVVGGVENLAEVAAGLAGIGAPVQAGINLVNNWMAEAIKVEAIAAGAATQTGSGPVKAAAVINSMIPELVQYMQAQGITNADITSQATAINNAVVNLLNTVGSIAPAPTGTVAPVTTPAS